MDQNINYLPFGVKQALGNPKKMTNFAPGSRQTAKVISLAINISGTLQNGFKDQPISLEATYMIAEAFAWPT